MGDIFINTNDSTSVSSSQDVAILSKEFVLTDSSLVSNTLDGNVPTWLSEAIENAVLSGNMTLEQAVDDLAKFTIDTKNSMDSSLKSMSSDIGTIAVRADSLEASTNNAIASINQTMETKVDSDGVTSIVASSVGSKWLKGNETEADAYINDKATTIANDSVAGSATIHGLTATVNDPVSGNEALAVSLLTKEKILAGKMYKLTSDDWDRISQGRFTPQFSMYKESDAADSAPDDSGVFWQYVGDELPGFGDNGWIKLNSNPEDGKEASGWIGYSSKILTGSGGTKTGYQFLGTNGGNSEFIIYADNFKIQQNGSKLPAFEIKGNHIYLRGAIAPGESIISDGFSYGHTGSIPKSATPSGFRLDTITTPTVERPSIYGGIIRGAVSINTSQFVVNSYGQLCLTTPIAFIKSYGIYITDSSYVMGSGLYPLGYCSPKLPNTNAVHYNTVTPLYAQKSALLTISSLAASEVYDSSKPVESDYRNDLGYSSMSNASGLLAAGWHKADSTSYHVSVTVSLLRIDWSDNSDHTMASFSHYVGKDDGFKEFAASLGGNLPIPLGVQLKSDSDSGVNYFKVFINTGGSKYEATSTVQVPVIMFDDDLDKDGGYYLKIQGQIGTSDENPGDDKCKWYEAPITIKLENVIQSYVI